MPYKIGHDNLLTLYRRAENADSAMSVERRPAQVMGVVEWTNKMSMMTDQKPMCQHPSESPVSRAMRL